MNKIVFRFNNFSSQNKLNSNYADGFGAEIFPFFVLETLHREAKKKSQREHVTKYIWDNIEKFKILSIPAPHYLAYPKLKFDRILKTYFKFLLSIYWSKRWTWAMVFGVNFGAVGKT